MSEDTVRDCVSRLFMVRMKLGDFDPPEMNPYKKLGYCLMQQTSLIPFCIVVQIEGLRYYSKQGTYSDSKRHGYSVYGAVKE